MATLTTQQITILGGAITPVAAAGGGDKVLADERSWLTVINGGGSPVTATIAIPGSTNGQANPDVAVTVPAGATRHIGPLTPAMADPSTGYVDVTYSGVTSVTVAATRI